MSNYPPGVTTKMIDESQGAHIDPLIDVSDDLMVEVYRDGVIVSIKNSDGTVAEKKLTHAEARYMAHRILERL